MTREEVARLPTDALLAGALERARSSRDSDDEQRWLYVSALHGRPEERVLRTASDWCRSEDEAERELGVDVLAQLGHAGVDGRSLFAAERLAVVRERLGDESTAVLNSALVALGHLATWGVDWPTELVAEAADHTSAEVRLGVTHALGTGRCDTCPRATEILCRLSADADRDVRNWATFGLGVMSDVDGDAVREALRARLADPDDEVRGEALVGLARRGDRATLPALLAELQREVVGILAIDAAAELGAPELVEALEEVATWWPEEARRIREAIEACSRGDGPTSAV